MEELNKQTIIDEEHLRLLVIFHRIYGIITIIFSLLGFAYYLFFNFLFSYFQNYSRFTIQNNFQAPPEEIMHIFLIIIAVLIIIGFTIGVCNILSAQFIKNRKFRIFSMIIAGTDCISFPLGTILGVMTLIVLSRNSVIQLYMSLNNVLGMNNNN
jgi:hypothetical protein